LLEAAGGEARTFSGLAGLGNLLVRGGKRGGSREYQLGCRLAEGKHDGEAGRIEGARAALAGATLSDRLRVRMPVLTGVAAVLAGRAEPRDVAKLIGDTVAIEE
jgi:glycerol-3-phosphate dehydrogenase (NAD(P)+)